MPLVSVLLPVYNCAGYIEESVNSVLGQTFADFELLILDDGSTDATPSVLATLRDPRIAVIRHPNMGLPATLNKGIGQAKGTYIARQDADDVSLPERLAKQVAFMEANPNCGLVGTWSRILRDREPTDRMHTHPADHRSLAFEILFDSQFVHPSVMFRREVTQRAGFYSTDLAKRGPEDYDYWVRIARQFQLGNVPEPLILYRETPGSMSRSGGEAWREKVMRISGEAIAWAADVELPDRAVEDITALWHYAFHKASPDPDFTRMRDVLRRASVRVADPGEVAMATRRADARLGELQSRHRTHRSGPPSTASRVLRRVSRMLGLHASR